MFFIYVVVHSESYIDTTHSETNTLVEEFMLLANITVAQRIYEEFPKSAVLRKHPPPPLSNFESLLVAAKTKVI